jgi:superfamily II DNA/RNA helicase
MTDTIQNPSTQAATLPAAFVALGLAQPLIQAVADLGFTQPTLVQQAAIPKAMQVGVEAQAYTDLMVSSQTGSGKTAAFLLPVLHTLLQQQQAHEAKERADWERQVAEALAAGKPEPKRAKRKNPLLARHFKPAVPGALVLCPTRELAQQVAHDAIDLVQHCRGLRIANVVGGMPYQMQIAKLQNADLVVATPGRLLDLQRSGQIKLDEVQFLVVDEADRMLDLGFSDDLAEINRLTAARRQTMMFSATFAPRIQALATRVMRSPQKVQIDTPQDKHVNIEQRLYWCDSPEHKRKLLDHWLRDASIDQAIVFASTQIECDALAADLQQVGFAAVALHGALSQGLRNRRLMALRNGQVQILVATDVAARGIDVPTITHVFNFGLPMKAEDYTHRIGRTGRAGRQGLAVTMAEFRDRRKIGEIEAFSQQKIDTQTIAGLEPRKPVYEFRDERRGSRGGRHAPPRHGASRGEGGFRAEGGFRGDGGGFRGEGGFRNDGGFRGASSHVRAAGEGPRVGFAKPAGHQHQHQHQHQHHGHGHGHGAGGAGRQALGDKRVRHQDSKSFAPKGRATK